MLSWLKKKEVPIAAPFAAIGTDMHSHLIPGIDDGAKSVEGAIALVEGLSKLGYKKLITTPHVMSDYYKNAPETILAGLETVRAEIDRQNIDIQIDVAAEYYLDEPFLEKIGKEQLLTFGDNYLLFELSYLNPPGELMEAIFKMKSHGYQPVLAHPERYPYLSHGKNLVEFEAIKKAGALLQLNITSLSGAYSRQAKETARRLIDADMVDFAGTDVHHIRHIERLRTLAKDKHFQKLLTSQRLLNRSLIGNE